MIRDYLRVIPTSLDLHPDVISTALASLHKLSANESAGFLSRLIPFLSQPPLRFEFVVLSDGEDGPVEFYYGADDHLDALEQRLRSTYPLSYDIGHVEVDLTKRLLQPVDILREFAEHESHGREVDQTELELIADAVNGDARVAITTLRIVARRAEEQAVERITEEIVESALPEARQEVRRKSIEMLSPHQRATYQVIEEHKRIAPGELIEENRERVDDPKSNRTIRNYLNKLERYDLVAAEGTTRDRMYRCLVSR